MDDITKATIAALRGKISALASASALARASAKVEPELSYDLLPLCVIYAVFSIGVRFRNAEKAVESWCVAQTPNWPKDGADPQARHTITDLIRVTNGDEGVALAQKFFGGNRQRTSSRGGILKADAVVRFAKALQGAGIDDLPDIRDAARVERAWQAVRTIPGQGSGLSFNYFLMLAGDESRVKPDRMVCRFVAKAAGLPNVSLRMACHTVVAASRALVGEFPNLTPRLLDYLIWSYQHAQPQPGHEAGHSVDDASPEPCVRPRPTRA